MSHRPVSVLTAYILIEGVTITYIHHIEVSKDFIEASTHTYTNINYKDLGISV